MNKETQAALSTMLKENLKKIHTMDRFYSSQPPSEDAGHNVTAQHIYNLEIIRKLFALYETAIVLIEDSSLTSEKFPPFNEGQEKQNKNETSESKPSQTWRRLVDIKTVYDINSGSYGYTIKGSSVDIRYKDGGVVTVSLVLPVEEGDRD